MPRLYFTLLLLLISNHFIAQDTIRVNIDLGGTDTELPWNTLTNSENGQIENLLSMNGAATEIDISISDDFNGTNTNGTLKADADLEFPSFATGDSFFGNAIEWNGATQETAEITLSDLDPETSYTIDLFASRLANDNRESQYVITGSTTTTLLLNPADNASDIVSAININPSAEGEIRIQASAGPNNNNQFGFYYLGIISIQYIGIVEAVEPALILISPTGREYYQSGKTPQIKWQSQGIAEVILEFSSNAGKTWSELETVNALSQVYDWIIPDLDSKDCLIRISGDTITKISSDNFTINNTDTTACHIVVLGSSTAAGTGPSTLDSAWVWMYRDTLFQNDTRFTVTNLAQGGFTTYNILPTGSSIPVGVSQTVNVSRNITQALSLNPNAVIINLPSNDAANGFTVETQLENYDLILDGLEQLEIPYWICTPQPRNGFSDAQKAIQTNMRDSTFTRFGDFAIDFWTNLATTEDNVDDAYNSGDGVHLNNAGHKILLDRVLQSQIPDFLLDFKNEGTSSQQDIKYSPLVFYPNPTSDFVMIENLEPPFAIQIYDVNGRSIVQYSNYFSNRIALPISGLQYVKIIKEHSIFGSWVVKN